MTGETQGAVVRCTRIMKSVRSLSCATASLHPTTALTTHAAEIKPEHAHFGYKVYCTYTVGGIATIRCPQRSNLLVFNFKTMAKTLQFLSEHARGLTVSFGALA
eukprot:1540802-Rhodomonas_salina.1